MKSRVGGKLPFHPQPEQPRCRANTVSSRELEPLERAAASFHHLAPILSQEPPTPGTHICSAVGSIDKAKVWVSARIMRAHFSWP